MSLYVHTSSALLSSGGSKAGISSPGPIYDLPSCFKSAASKNTVGPRFGQAPKSRERMSGTRRYISPVHSRENYGRTSPGVTTKNYTSFGKMPTTRFSPPPSRQSRLRTDSPGPIYMPKSPLGSTPTGIRYAKDGTKAAREKDMRSFISPYHSREYMSRDSPGPVYDVPSPLARNVPGTVMGPQAVPGPYWGFGSSPKSRPGSRALTEHSFGGRASPASVKSKRHHSESFANGAD
mmetsp:Transcript_17377/g.43280  ORF Transcript_17377/g.43280 Transcript_17377/m.43280 type:complete len:235 (-) Transcript_17377:479-1183(-)|eukprot:CAMPEP_0113889784 /NCGR_PEP_ID=MMETSP0780_2-20120614/13731_1 /TAXON_ID=652834 /ORGANISM="Palpitomonas bilix" /LENGTH=234 /DNA_ID=CAMNT_0000879005 /DNA_START=191 /DNA_END=895 /DNA_ORIENTATION=+ /assembly_acc=CAM_ASM_000599